MVRCGVTARTLWKLFDRKIFGEDAEAFWNSLLTQAGGCALGEE
jgi:hypothetical protein